MNRKSVSTKESLKFPLTRNEETTAVETEIKSLSTFGVSKVLCFYTWMNDLLLFHLLDG